MRADIWLLALIWNKDGQDESPNIWAAEVRTGPGP